jgi:hypothetical protein
MGGKNKDHKARDWHTISRRGPQSVSRRRGGAFRLVHDLLISAALLPISGPAGKSGQRNCCQNPSVNRRPFALAANGQSRSCLSLLLYWVANCGVQDTLITQPFNCRGRSSESITSLISQQGGLICRS